MRWEVSFREKKKLPSGKKKLPSGMVSWMIITGFSSLQACTDKSTVWCFQKVTGEVVYQIHAHSETISGTSEGGRLLRERHYLVSSDPPPTHRPQSELLCAWTTGDCRHR